MQTVHLPGHVILFAPFTEPNQTNENSRKSHMDFPLFFHYFNQVKVTAIYIYCHMPSTRYSHIKNIMIIYDVASNGEEVVTVPSRGSVNAYCPVMPSRGVAFQQQPVGRLPSSELFSFIRSYFHAHLKAFTLNEEHPMTYTVKFKNN